MSKDNFLLNAIPYFFVYSDKRIEMINKKTIQPLANCQHQVTSSDVSLNILFLQN